MKNFRARRVANVSLCRVRLSLAGLRYQFRVYPSPVLERGPLWDPQMGPSDKSGKPGGVMECCGSVRWA
jgi:hypothetical protein